MLCVRARGQSTLEYVILIGFVVAALIAMGVYMKRGIQGRLRESTDQVGQQYSAGNTTGSYTTDVDFKQTENVKAKGETTTVIDTNKQTKTGFEEVADWSNTGNL
jgi:Flp pilus assembly pilin Flp